MSEKWKDRIYDFFFWSFLELPVPIEVSLALIFLLSAWLAGYGSRLIGVLSYKEAEDHLSMLAGG